MARRIDCPFGGWIELPDEWLGEHARRRDEASAKAANLPWTFRQFTLALALLENWGGIPGLDGNPEKWDFERLPWAILAWLPEVVFADVKRSMAVPKNSLPPSPVGLTAEMETTIGPSGSSETTEPAS